MKKQHINCITGKSSVQELTADEVSAWQEQRTKDALEDSNRIKERLKKEAIAAERQAALDRLIDKELEANR